MFNQDNLKEYLFHLTKQAKIRNNDTYRTVEELFNSGAVTKSHEKSYEGNANKCEEYDNISNKTNIINNNKITLNSSKKQNGTYSIMIITIKLKTFVIMLLFYVLRLP